MSTVLGVLYRSTPTLVALLAWVACGNQRIPESSDASTDSRPGDPSSVPIRVNAQQSPEAGADDPPLVQTAYGAVRGSAAGNVERFLGIPYAAPPVNGLRLAPPAAPAAWTEVRDATAFGSVCPQRFGSSVIGNEDCLSLNVYRPAHRDPSRSLPVTFWIHGGSFTTGAGSVYDPHRLVETNDIVVVTINYRLGPLGFLALPALTAESGNGLSGDYGLMDQQAAMRWVRDNIAAFGGDPARVTLQGESAGGASVCAHLASPPAAGLFARAIIQSASCASARVADAEPQGTRIAASLGCNDPAQAGACLRQPSVSTERLINASVNAGAVYGAIYGGTLLPSPPNDVVRAGRQARVPVLLGGLRDEMLGFAAPLYRTLDAANYPRALSTWFPNIDPNTIIALYPLDAYPDPFFALSAVFSDSGVFYGQALGGCVTAALADALSASTTTYAYELDDPNFVWAPGVSLFPRGATHTSDLSYLFDLSIPLNRPFDASQTALADTMVRTFGAFVRTGNPSAASIVWPVYRVPQRSMVHFEPDQVRIVNDFRERHHCDFWQTALGAPAGDGGL